MNKTFELLFYVKKIKMIANGTAPEYDRNETAFNGSRPENTLLKRDEPEKGKMLVPIFEEHNRQVKALIGREYAQGTLDRYQKSLKHTVAFIQWKYKVSDINIRGIDHEFSNSLR